MVQSQDSSGAKPLMVKGTLRFTLSSPGRRGMYICLRTLHGPGGSDSTKLYLYLRTTKRKYERLWSRPTLDRPLTQAILAKLIGIRWPSELTTAPRPGVSA